MKNYLNQYKTAHLIRIVQNTLMNEYHPADEMRCPIHFCAGQEIVPSFLGELLTDKDYIMSHHRSHGYYLAKNGSLNAMVSEFYGRESGSNGGLAGSQELSYEPINFYSGTILAGMFAMSTGTSFSMKYQNSDSITVTVIGDGGIEEGICWEALNMASVMSLPIVFIIENNGYSVHTDINKRTKLNNLHERVATFGVPSIKVSCLDFEGLDSALNKAVTEARVNRNPSCIEVDVWRYAPHVGPENDDQEYHYRNKELVKFWSKNDPLLKLRELILASGLKKEVDSIESRNKKLIDDAIKLAKDGTFPKLSNVIKHNLSQSYSTKINEIRLVTTSGDYLKNQPDTIVTPY